MPVKKIKFPDGKVRKVNLPSGLTPSEEREMALRYYEENIVDSDLPTDYNLQEAQDRADANREPEPTAWERAGAALDAGTNLAANAATGLVTGPLSNAQSLANLVTSGDFGSYEGARRALGESQERAGRYAVPPVSELGGEYAQNVGQTLSHLEGIAPNIGGMPLRAPQRPLTGFSRKGNATPGGNLSAAQAADDASMTHQTQNRIYEAEQAGVVLTPGQATRKLDIQAKEDALTKTPEGQPLKNHFEGQQDQLHGEIDRAAFDAADDPDYRPLGPGPIGAQTKQTFQVAKDRAWKEVDDAYNAARASDEVNNPVPSDQLTSLWSELSSGSESRSTLTRSAYKELTDYAVEMRIAEVIDDKVVFSGGTVSKLEDFRQEVGNYIDQANPQQRRLGQRIKDTIDQQLDEADSGELFKEARAKRRQFSVDYDENDFVNRLLGQKGQTSRDLIPDEQVTAHVQKLPRAELIRVRDQLQGLGDEGALAWRRLRSSVVREIGDTVTNMNQRGMGDVPTVNAAKLGQIIDDLRHEGKLEVLFGEDIAARLGYIANTARATNQTVRGAVNHSNTAAANIRAAGALIGLLGKIPGVGIATDALVKQRQSKANTKAVQEALAGPGMLGEL